MNPAQGGWVILLSLLVALLLGVAHLPEDWSDWLGWLRPNWLLLVVLFWVIELPRRLGLITVWCVGIVADVLYAEPLGLNALMLACVSYLGWRFCERLRMYSVLQQCGVSFVLVLAGEILRVWVIGLNSDAQWSWGILLVPIVSMLMWPVVLLLLLRARTGIRVE